MHDAFQVTESSATRLVITAPASSMLLSWIGMLLAVVLIMAVLGTSVTVRRVMAYDRTPEQLASYVRTYRVIGLAGTVGILLLFAALFYSSGSIILDHATGTASMRAKMTAFLPAQTVSMPLRDVESATLDAKPNSRRIRLLARSGHDIGYPLWSNRPGQQNAVDAINNFVRETH